MKLRLLLALTISGLLFSCSDDDDVVAPVDTTAGTYLLTAINSGVAVDLNDDGVSSNNQLDETVCFDGSYLTLNANNTFITSGKGVEINFDGQTSTLGCYDDGTLSGTWIRTGNSIALTYTDEGEEYTDTAEINNNVISSTTADGEVVGNGPNGEPAYLTTDITIVFTKQ